ncbi:MAG TPA: DUF1501 domain-containing protein [Gemmataceae bacterium]|jgi:hypothetical protein|nr:DUF1501 domain-containing protein [Gemmataceae bacterium]
MLHLLKDTPSYLCDGISRREWLQLGGLGILGLSLPALLRAENRARQAGHRGTAKACIMLFLAGGPSHHDMWDMKPDAPKEIRGEFKPIATTVPGIQLSEHLPRLARQAKLFTLVRSAHHSVANAHWAATYFALTGEDLGDFTVAIAPGPNDHPAIGSVLSHLRPPQRPIVPFVSLPYVTAEGRGGPPQPGIYGGWLGRTYDPLIITEDPNGPDFGIPELTLKADVTMRRLDGRKGLLAQVNHGLDGLQRSGTARMMSTYRQKAFSLLTSDATRKAFDLAKEAPKVRDSYGRNIYGQSVLLARRLIEAGSRMVTVKWAPDANATWDTHGNNFGLLKNELLPQLDAGLASLLSDLEDRGLLDETLIVCMGEFGRSPRVNPAAGRDHWPRCYSLLLAGGGVPGGSVFGKSDRIGSDPAENPVTPHDLIATFYSLLGIPPETELPDQLGRPIRLGGSGQVIRELIA